MTTGRPTGTAPRAVRHSPAQTADRHETPLESLRAFTRKLSGYRYVTHQDPHGYVFDYWTGSVPAAPDTADIICSELADREGRHAILLTLDFDFDFDGAGESLQGHTVVTMRPPGRSRLTSATVNLFKSYYSMRRLERERSRKAGWGVTERDIHKLDKRLRAAGLNDVVAVAHRDLPRPTGDRKGRFYLELAFADTFWIAESETPGHHDLYVDVDSGLTTKQYGTLRKALYKAGVLNRDYVWARPAYLAPPWVNNTRD